MIQIISVDGVMTALDKETGSQKWVSQLNIPMIGSFEFDNQTIGDNIFIPLIDGSLIRFDKDGYLEVSTKYDVILFRERHLMSRIKILLNFSIVKTSAQSQGRQRPLPFRLTLPQEKLCRTQEQTFLLFKALKRKKFQRKVLK